MLKTSELPTIKKRMANNKIVLGFAALVTSAIIGMAGLAGAAPNQPQSGSGYGGGNTVNLGIEVHGNNNVINVIIRLFSGN